MKAHQTLRLTIIGRTAPVVAPFLRRHVPAVHRLVKSSLRELSIALVGDIAMSRLHERFLGKHGPTDVLTFALETGRRNRATSGEIVICIPEARRQARARKIPLQHEILLYAVHGLLHLHGLDDSTPSGYRTMHRKEDDLLRRIGVGPVFHGQSG